TKPRPAPWPAWSTPIARPTGCCWSGTIPGWSACWPCSTAASPATTAACRRRRWPCCTCPKTRRSSPGSLRSHPSGGREVRWDAQRLPTAAVAGAAGGRDRPVRARGRDRYGALPDRLHPEDALGTDARRPVPGLAGRDRGRVRRAQAGAPAPAHARRGNPRPPAIFQGHPRQRLLRRGPAPVGRVRVRPLHRRAAARGRPAGWGADDPRRAPARGVHARARHLRPSHPRLRRGRQRRGLPQRLCDGPLGLRPVRSGGVQPAHPHAARHDAMSAMRALFALLVLACSGCGSLSALQRDQAAAIAAQARSTVVVCDAADACARPSPLRELGERAMAASTPQQPRHYALLLDYGQDALVSRLDLIRGAQRSIDLQTYIFDEDDAGHLVLDELMAAVQRGVRVRMLVDQLSALKQVDTLAA